MGAEITYKVRVLRLVEDWEEVSAVTGDEAMEAAQKLPGVARALDAYHPVEYDEILIAENVRSSLYRRGE